VCVRVVSVCVVLCESKKRYHRNVRATAMGVYRHSITVHVGERRGERRRNVATSGGSC
jgi:hypothetical protein